MLVLAILALVVLAVVVWRQHRAHEGFRQRLQVALGSSSDSAPTLLAAVGERATELDRAGRYSDQLEQALNASPVGILIVDNDANDVYMNPTAAAYATGRAGDAVVGIRLREIIAAVAGNGEAQEQEIEVFTPSQRTILVRAIPLYVGDERRGTAAFADDRTPHSRLNTMRRDFVANASHELKTPIGALRLLAEALVATTDHEVQESISERIQSEASRMTRLVEDILDLSLIEEHQTVRGVVDVCDVIRDAVQQAALASEALAVPVEFRCDDVGVLGDHRRLVSAVANLIENAITYTAAKGLAEAEPVQVHAYEQDGNAHIVVEDHGIGIAARHQTRIFERFYRVDKGRSRASGGTGLGLAIVRHVVQNHWGEVEVESTPGRGSTFHIVLPGRES